MKRVSGTGAVLVLSLMLLALGGCYSTCPGGHDPGANPAGCTCSDDSDCQIECVCLPTDAEQGDDGEGVVVGDCVGDQCADGDQICRNSCGTDAWTGEYCEVAE